MNQNYNIAVQSWSSRALILDLRSFSALTHMTGMNGWSKGFGKTWNSNLITESGLLEQGNKSF